jgi:enhancing lycopene biosynthesis protein 2
MKIGVLLSGCGIYDGSGIHEAVLSLLVLDRLAVDYECFAPDSLSDVCNPITKDKLPQPRNILIESARIARGKIRPLAEFEINHFDGIVIPGGYYPITEPPFAAMADAIRQTAKAGKPIAAISTSAIWVADVLQTIDIEAKITLGQPEYHADNQSLIDWIAQAAGRNITVVNADADNVIEDDLNNIVTTAGYLSSHSMAQVFEGIEKTITKLVEMVTLVMST